LPAAAGLITEGPLPPAVGAFLAKVLRRWIDAERIPYLRLPSGGYRIPVGALLASLGGNYALGEELDQIEERMAGVSEDDVRAALE
jgi:hypothetical protein